MKKSILIPIFALSVLAGCASTKPHKVYAPNPKIDVIPFYSKGLPIAAVNADSALLLVSLEPTVISGRRYMRLWLLWNNYFAEPFLFEPLKDVKLKMEGPLSSNEPNILSGLVPESPTKMLARIKNEEAIALILEGIGGALQAAAKKPTEIKSSHGEKFAIDEKTTKFTVNDREEKAALVQEKTIAIMHNIANWYEVFSQSISEGIFRRNTIFQGQPLNGYIYFRHPNDEFFNPEKFRYTIEIATPGGTKVVSFDPEAGE